MGPEEMSGSKEFDPVQAARRRRFLTVMFSDLTGSTGIGERIEAETFAEVLRELRTIARSVVAKHGGQIARIQSDGVLAIFGYDGVREDDGRRATEVALELHRLVGAMRSGVLVGLDEPLALHTGIHAGVCFVDVGDVERGRFRAALPASRRDPRLPPCAGVAQWQSCSFPSY